MVKINQTPRAPRMIISKGNFNQDTLKGEIAIVTGAGRGIGFEAARSLVWLGAQVVIAEVNEKNGKIAEEKINKEFGGGKALFVKTDVGNEKDIGKMAAVVFKKFGKVDIVLNNATVFPMGAVKDTPIASWDFSYGVNLRGPVLLARKFLPFMMERKHGTFVCVSSSGAAPFMGAYEVFKTAQVELANTIAAEVEGTGVYVFTIGPGISRTPGFMEGGAKVASLMGMSLDELFELNKNAQISPEAAGAGFAIAIALAQKYHGQETSSIQVLREAKISFANEEETELQTPTPSQEQQSQESDQVESRSVSELYEAVMKTYIEQSEGWKKRNLFERQWISRDFKKNTGITIDEMQMTLKALGNSLNTGAPTTEFIKPLNQLAAYYLHQQEQLKSFEKNLKKLEENLKIIDGWIRDAKALVQALN
ncbi:SDR family oxidoreductase [Candidatus Bathyarchaeota archaeon A05DMB-2]|jgi:NAD(P)-dependent dehydrogenase (short-subunit alcohol dehydrogenase family)|nr:SDR family oxidoreductase [Candidatus Bathyarchaeota archaeon A05DMB-2]